MYNKKRVIASILLGLSTISFSGCGEVGDENNTTTGNVLDMLNGEKPTITLEGSTDIKISLGTQTIMTEGDSWSAYDPQDGDISSQVVRTHNIDFSKAGTYQIEYNVQDTDGNNADTKTRTVTITSADYEPYRGDTQTVGSVPVISFSDGDTVYLAVGQQYNNTTYRATDLEDGDLTQFVTVEGLDFNINTAGTHNVAYTVSDKDGNSVTKNRTVYVGDFGDNSDFNWYDGSGSDIDDFRAWYSTTCGKTFNNSLYNSNTGQYSGEISCSGKKLTSIDLTTMAIFSTIKSIDLSDNRLENIDFTPLASTNVINKIDLSSNRFSYIDFSPLFNLNNIDELYIQNNNLNYTKSEREELYRGFNNRSLFIGF